MSFGHWSRVIRRSWCDPAPYIGGPQMIFATVEMLVADAPGVQPPRRMPRNISSAIASSPALALPGVASATRKSISASVDSGVGAVNRDKTLGILAYRSELAA